MKLKTGLLIILIVILSTYAVDREMRVSGVSDELSSCRSSLLEYKDEIKTLEKKNEELKKELSIALNNTTSTLQQLEELRKELEKLREERDKLLFELGERDYWSANYYVVAVKKDGKEGRVLEFRVALKPGDGGVFVNLSRVLTAIETQESLINAIKAAEVITGKKLDNYDIFFHFNYTKRVGITGPSAGSALCLAIVAAIENKTLSKEVLITGSVDERGNIGSVGEVLEKARAARQFGAKIFLVPKGEKVTVEGLKVIEVRNIREAMNYVFD
jgi:predicted ATP-dependent serine protease